MAEVDELADLSYSEKARLIGEAVSDLFHMIYTIATTPTDRTGEQSGPAPYENDTEYRRHVQRNELPRPQSSPPRLELSQPPNPEPQELSTTMPGSWEVDGPVERHGDDQSSPIHHDVVTGSTIGHDASYILADNTSSTRDDFNLATLQPELNNSIPATPNDLAPSVTLNTTDVSLVIDPPSPTTNCEPPRPDTTQPQDEIHGEDSASPQARQDVQAPDLAPTATQLTTQSPSQSSLNVPLNAGAHRSQDHLSVSPHDGTSSQPSSPSVKQKKGGIRGFFRKLKPKSSAPPTPPSPVPSSSPRPSIHTVSSQRGEADQHTPRPLVGADHSELLSDLTETSIITLAEITAEIAPLPFVNELLEALKIVANGIDGVRTNRYQWNNLWHHCTIAILICTRQMRLAEHDEEQHAILTECFDKVQKVVKRVELAVIKWNNMHKVTAFLLHRSMSDEIENLFQDIHRVLKTFSLGATGLQLVEAGHAQFKQTQKDESRAIETLHKRIAAVAKDIETIKDDPDKVEAMMTTVENALKPALKEYWKTATTTDGRTRADAHQIVALILSLTGLSAPPAIFRGEVCEVVNHEEIHRGTACTVFKAKLPSGEEVAKKVFHLNYTSKQTIEGYAKKISRDAQVWYNFSSDYTLRFYGVGIEGSSLLHGVLKLYMISPLMPNLDAMKYFKTRRGNISNKDILRVVMDAALGLQYVHSKNTVHSGLCGGNVLVRDTGRGVLGGFGLTKVLRNPGGEKLPDAEQTGHIPSQRWMAPETTIITTGLPNITQANDVWGWAMTALEIISGEKPFKHVTQESNVGIEIRQNPKISREQYPTFESFAHQPDALWALFQKCWSLKPEDRPTMNEVVTQLEAIYQI
ncbi:hypothetical protein FRC09_010768 [Ceratobasidium sp. 395]|nr:hypothetical protein FRC09_010768 [Ceratobasidium sp. 395]